MADWQSGYGGARWLCALGLHPARAARDGICPACGAACSPSPHTSGSAADPSVESLTAELVGVREQLRQAEQELGARQKPRVSGEGEGLDRASAFVALGFPAKCYGHLRSFPPYVGGDDDEIDGWQAQCMCGWKGTETPHVGRAQGELLKHMNESVREIVRQHSRVWTAVTTGNGMRSPIGGEGWRDSEYREWERWVGPMVECPECAFTFGADHFDDTPEGGYSCPNCGQDDQAATPTGGSAASPELARELAALRVERDAAVEALEEIRSLDASSRASVMALEALVALAAASRSSTEPPQTDLGGDKVAVVKPEEGDAT